MIEVKFYIEPIEKSETMYFDDDTTDDEIYDALESWTGLNASSGFDILGNCEDDEE